MVPVGASALVTLAYLCWRGADIRWLNAFAALVGIVLLWTIVVQALQKLLPKMFTCNIIGDIVSMVVFALLPSAGGCCAATGTFDAQVFFAVVPLGLVAASLAHASKAEAIYAGNGVMNKRIVYIYGFELFCAFVWLAIFSVAGILPVSTVFVFLAFPVAVGCVSTINKSVEGGNQILGDMYERTANFQLIFSVLVSIVLAVACVV